MDIKKKLKYYYGEQKEAASSGDNYISSLGKELGGYVIEPEGLPILKIESFEKYSTIDPQDEFKWPYLISIPLLSRKQFTGGIDPGQILIFDLETTGLAGGTGTYPFLIGFGCFEVAGIRIYQYLLPDYGREISAFSDMLTMIKDKRILLSFNGKSFDYPLIRNRLIINRVDNPFKEFAHLDLLHSARRLWKNYLPSCSLEMIEQKILHFSRWRDIDGYMIPHAYFNFLNTGDTFQLNQIIKHNQQDIFSLARLLFHMHRVENGVNNKVTVDHEFVPLFDLAVKIGDTKEINSVLDRVDIKQVNLPTHSLKNYSLVLKREKNWLEAVSIWKNLLDDGIEVLFVCEEMAKFYEHHEKSASKAMEYTDRALKYLSDLDEIGIVSDLDKKHNRFNHRLNRLNFKITNEKMSGSV